MIRKEQTCVNKNIEKTKAKSTIPRIVRVSSVSVFSSPVLSLSLSLLLVLSSLLPRASALSLVLGVSPSSYPSGLYSFSGGTGIAGFAGFPCSVCFSCSTCMFSVFSSTSLAKGLRQSRRWSTLTGFLLYCQGVVAIFGQNQQRFLVPKLQNSDPGVVFFDG